MIWFTSDLHLNHRNIIRYCNRPLKILAKYFKPAEAFKYEEHQLVFTTAPVKREGLEIPARTRGTIVSVYNQGEAYAVEFPSLPDGPSVVTIYASEIERMKDRPDNFNTIRK